MLNHLKERNPAIKIAAVTGCVAQADGQKLLELAPQIDVLLGPGKIDELPRLLTENNETKKSVFATGFARHEHAVTSHTHSDPAHIPTVTGKKEITRLSILSKAAIIFCTFCVVPFTRGGRSRVKVLM